MLHVRRPSTTRILHEKPTLPIVLRAKRSVYTSVTHKKKRTGKSLHEILDAMDDTPEFGIQPSTSETKQSTLQNPKQHVPTRSKTSTSIHTARYIHPWNVHLGAQKTIHGLRMLTSFSRYHETIPQGAQRKSKSKSKR